MSRIGKQPVVIPSGTDVSIADGVVTVKGPKGELSRAFGENVTITIADNAVVTAPANDSSLAYALWGTYTSHIKNMVIGVNTPYEKKLVIEGVGYRAEMSGSTLVLSLGYSHKIEEIIPAELTVVVEKNAITVTGINKELVGQFTARVRSYRKPEPYKGKGIRYIDEVVKRKEGKKAV